MMIASKSKVMQSLSMEERSALETHLPPPSLCTSLRPTSQSSPVERLMLRPASVSPVDDQQAYNSVSCGHCTGEMHLSLHTIIGLFFIMEIFSDGTCCLKIWYTNIIQLYMMVTIYSKGGYASPNFIPHEILSTNFK